MANSTIIYACTDDGLAIFNKPGTLPEWLPPRRVLQGMRVGAAWGEPGPPMRVLVIADGKLLLSENGGRTWVPVGPEGQEAKVMSLDYNAERHVLTALTDMGDVWLSTDGGSTWEVAARTDRPTADAAQPYEATLPPGTLAFVDIPGGEGMPHALVAGTADGLQVSADGGTTWTEVSLPHEGTISALARDPERRDRLYAGSGTGYLFESGNRGRTWEAINDQPVGAVSALYVERI